MLDAKDRDWIQHDILEVREAWRRGSEWHGQKGLIGYLIFAMALAAAGGTIFGNREIGSFGASLALLICLALSGYYYYRKTEGERHIKRRWEIEEAFNRKGLTISHDGLTVSDGNSTFDPLSSNSYQPAN